jgi:fluoride exporter
MLVWIAVGLGGAFGAMARHGVNGLVHRHWPLLRFPLATAVVNILGCCLFGLLAGAVASGRLAMPVYWREFAFVGVIGGFTTFSTFGFDTLTLLRTGASAQAAFNVAVQLVGGIGGLYAGLLVAERLGPKIQ